MNTSFKKLIPFLIVNICIGIVIILIITLKSTPVAMSNIKRDNSDKFLFTSPILDCENVSQGNTISISYKDLNTTATNLAQQYDISKYSIYFRDLNNGPWVGLNEKESFSPASLMKTSLLISFLKQVERDPELIKKEVVATDEYFNYSIDQNFELKTKVIKGQTYSLEEIAGLMITESDNVAASILSKYINQADFNLLLKTVGVPFETKNTDVDIRVKDFAGFFRILYNASYLNRENSEAALRLFSQSTFDAGIVAGVPKGVSVAHKYGERSLEQKQDGISIIKELQLHDCGIVYAEEKPYILCIMTRGQDFKKQIQFIASISEYIYKNSID
jgi:beta-lactamase class A